MVVVARGLPSRASKKLGTGDDKCDPGAVFSRPEGGGGSIRNVLKQWGGSNDVWGGPKGHLVQGTNLGGATFF
jgi:hypothetical protein